MLRKVSISRFYCELAGWLNRKGKEGKRKVHRAEDLTDPLRFFAKTFVYFAVKPMLFQ